MIDWPSDEIIRVEDAIGVSLVMADWISAFSVNWFEPDYWKANCVRITEGGRGAAWFIDTPSQQHWVLRQFQRGGLPGKLIKNRYLYMGEAQVRSFREFRLLLWMRKQGLPVPDPVAARSCRFAKATYSASILLERIPGACSLGERGPGQDEGSWQAAGECVRRFHDAGIYHADLNCTNILVSPSGIHLIDFDRGVQYAQHSPSSAWRRANIKRLHRSVDKRLGDLPAQHRATLWQAFTTGYAR